ENTAGGAASMMGIGFAGGAVGSMFGQPLVPVQQGGVPPVQGQPPLAAPGQPLVPVPPAAPAAAAPAAQPAQAAPAAAPAAAAPAPAPAAPEAAAPAAPAAGAEGPKFCPNCGTPSGGARFCPNCGFQLRQ
ncbi:MAG: zinc ribbon domain-containing protein, partial [Bifidobacteriaceae bacterium]|nr:zinc ribbon domain-containing protein [Bifidobacteriaceae bacterium]